MDQLEVKRKSGELVRISVGNRFGRLLVKSLGLKRSGFAVALCQCDCGKVSFPTVYQLIRNDYPTVSCGCLQKERASKIATSLRTHGLTNSPEYRAWRAMKSRCYNSRVKYYRHYGGRGITVCDRWLNSFEAFLEDMGSRPAPSMSLDRIDVNGNYEPSNCRWATPKQQSNNQRKTLYCTYQGRRMTLKQLAQLLGINYSTLHCRLYRYGLSLERATTQGRLHGKRKS